MRQAVRLAAAPPLAYTLRVVARQGLAFFDARVGVTSDDDATLTWLREFLTPAFAPCTAGDRDVSVMVCRDAERYTTVAAGRPPGPLPLVACFARDEKITRRPSWRWQRHAVIGEDRLGALYVLGRSGVEILAVPGAGRFRTAVMRVVRELAVAQALCEPRRVLVHAAAVVHAGAGVLFAGPRTCGKTTMLSYVARTTRAAILANDRVVLSDADGGWDARGVPTIASFRRGTFELMPDLRHRLPADPTPVDRTLAEAAMVAGASASPGPTAERTKLSPAQLAYALGTTLADRAPLAAIAFPDPRGGADEITVERLDPAAALECVQGARFGIRVQGEEPTIFAELSPGSRPPEADAAAFARLAAEIPCWRVRIGPDALRDGAAAARLFATILG